MNDALQAAIREAYASAPSHVAILETLEISHPAVGGTIYLVKNSEDLTMKLENGTSVLFEAAGFRMTLPAVTEDGLQELRIAIDNVDRRISDFLDQAKNSTETVKVKYRPYLSTDLETPQMNPPLELNLTDVSVTVFEVTARATFADIINKKFPSDIYTRARFPSLGN